MSETRNEWQELAEGIEKTVAACVERIDGDFDIEAYLDLRDSDAFDQSWVDADAEVERRQNALPDDRREALEQRCTELRRSVFQIALKRTRHPDLAAAVSDDAGLIFEDSAADGPRNAWVGALYLDYQERRLPAGERHS